MMMIFVDDVLLRIYNVGTNILQIFARSSSRAEAAFVRFRLYKRLCLQWATRANAPLVYRFHSLTAAYAPHAGYSEQDFANFFEQLHSALHGAYRDGRRVILGGDLNLQIDVGKRGEQFASLCSGFGPLITNDDDHHDPLEDTWAKTTY